MKQCCDPIPGNRPAALELWNKLWNWCSMYDKNLRMVLPVPRFGDTLARNVLFKGHVKPKKPKNSLEFCQQKEITRAKFL
jgi:hypothetical protein